MKSIFIVSLLRSFVGIVVISVFFFADMLSTPEYRKLIGWAILYGVGLSSALSIWFSQRLASYVMRSIWIISCIDLGIRGFLRLYFGITPGSIEIFSTLFATSKDESTEFFISEWRLFALVVCISLAVLIFSWFTEKKILQRFPSVQPVTLMPKVTYGILFILFCLALFNPAMRHTNNLLYWVMSYRDYQGRIAELADFQKKMVITPEQLAQIHYQGEPQRTVILVIGESLTRHNMSLYGYPRQTTPLLDKQKSDLLIFNDVISGGYVTASAIPKLLTAADIQHPEAWENSPSILMQAKAAGYKTFWLSNQLTFDGVISALSHQADVQKFDNYGNDIAEGAFDNVLFPDIQQALQDEAPKKFIVIHLLGSHMHYDLRYPKNYQQFDHADDTVSQHLKKEGRPDWVITTRNQYDNSVLFNDMVISHILDSLKTIAGDHPAAFAYLSDHGQEVGDERNYLGHSAVDKPGWEIPLIMWSNQNWPVPKAVLENRPYQSDRFDSTMLDLLKITSPYYVPNNDILSPVFITKDRFMANKLYQR